MARFKAVERRCGLACPASIAGPLCAAARSSLYLARTPLTRQLLPGAQVCKAKLGSHKRAKSKREDMAESMRIARMADKK